MTKAILIDTIGKLFVDDDFRTRFNTNKDEALRSIDLTDEERQFLKDKANIIRECTDQISVSYDGEDKRH